VGNKLLAPGGSMAMIKEILPYSDIIYVGLKGFSRRNYQYELSIEELKEAYSLVKKYNKTLYVAFNISYSDNIKNDIIYYMTFLYDLGIRDFIIKEPWYFSFLRDTDCNLIASTACNISTKRQIFRYKALGATQICASTDITNYKEIALFAENCKELEIKSEIMIHANLCPRGGVDSCPLVKIHFKDKIINSTRIGNPDQGHCHRWCIQSEEKIRDNLAGNHEKIINSVVKYTLTVRNQYFAFYSKELEKILKLDIDVLKINGREYPVEKAVHITSCYRQLLDFYLEKKYIDQYHPANIELMKLNRVPFSLALDKSK